MPVPGERPICHYTGKRCAYEGTACTCLLPGFVGTPPTWGSDTLRAELDKCGGLTEDEKEYLLVVACAGIEHARKLRAQHPCSYPNCRCEVSSAGPNCERGSAGNAGVPAPSAEPERKV